MCHLFATLNFIFQFLCATFSLHLILFFNNHECLTKWTKMHCSLLTSSSMHSSWIHFEHWHSGHSLPLPASSVCSKAHTAPVDINYIISVLFDLFTLDYELPFDFHYMYHLPDCVLLNQLVDYLLLHQMSGYLLCWQIDQQHYRYLYYLQNNIN